MYLLSVYFDEQTNKRIQRYVNQVAERTGNRFMLEGKVPPHITVSAFETKDEAAAVEAFGIVVNKLKKGKIQWATVGQFLPYVIYIAPVLNEYLHEMSACLYETFSKKEDVKLSPYYQPFQWLPHNTIGKKLTKEQMKVAFEVLQETFGTFEGEVVRIGLEKPNPHRDIVSFELKNK